MEDWSVEGGEEIVLGMTGVGGVRGGMPEAAGKPGANPELGLKEGRS